MEDKINWEGIKSSDKKGAGKPVNYIIDEMGQYDFGLNKMKNKEQGWKSIPIFTDK